MAYGITRVLSVRIYYYLTANSTDALALHHARFRRRGSQLCRIRDHGARVAAYGRTLTHGSDPSQMALTFDDGPNDPHTLHLLDVLAKHNARATFFLIGKYVRKRPDIVRAIAAAGHEIGRHTDRHPNLILVSAARLRQELKPTATRHWKTLWERVRLFDRLLAAVGLTCCGPHAAWGLFR